MSNRKSINEWDLERDLQHRIRPLLKNSPWVLRVTEYKDKPVPVFVVKERCISELEPKESANSQSKTILRDRGLLYGQPLRRCWPVIRSIISNQCDDAGVPLDLQRFLGNQRISFRGNLPLNIEAGVKLSLIFRLQERVKDMDRVELIAWRVERFTQEEAAYWLTRATQYGEATSRWARAGMRTILGGQPGDKAILEMLEKVRR